MASLKVKTGAKREVVHGRVKVEGPWVLLIQMNLKTGVERVVFGYCGQPGETITCDGEDYIVDF